MIPEQQNMHDWVEQQIIDLQTKLAYQEDIVQTLNDVVSAQQQDILSLKSQMAQLVDQLSQALASRQPDVDQAGTLISSVLSEKPPHY